MSQAQYQEFGPYRLTHLLGRGGMASVYRALKSGPMGFAKEVAIKRLHDALNDNDQILKSLINEARLGGQLRHPNIVEIYEFDKIGDNYYLAMEFVDGWTLDKIIKVSNEFEEPIPPTVVLEVLLQILEGLHYAHTLESLEGKEVRLVHRDLKPANIIVSRHGIAKIMDFGIAKAATNLFQTTMADVTKGTPHYMSPEQVAGEPDLKPTSDIFAMGSVIYELVTGKILFKGDNLSTVLFSVVKAEVGPQLDELDERVPGLGEIVGNCLRQNREERYQDVASLSRDLRALKAESGPGPTIRDYLYRLRNRVVSGQEGLSESATVHEAAPEFATLLQGSKKKVDPAVSQSSDLLRAMQADDEMRRSGRTTSDSVRAVSVGDVSSTGATQVGRVPAQQAATAARTSKGNPLVVPLVVALLALAGGVGWFVFRPAPSATTADAASTPAPPPAEAMEAPPPADLSLAGSSKTPDKGAKTAVPFAAPTGKGWPTAKTEPTASRGNTGTKAAPVAVPPPVPAPEPVRDSAPGIAPPAPPVVVETTPTAAPSVQRATGTGFLVVKPSSPWAQVWIDGVNTGEKTPIRKLPLPAGRHTVRLISSTMSGQVEKTIEIAADQTTVLGKYDFTSETWSE